MIDLWESDKRENELFYFGWFLVLILGYFEMLNLKINVYIWFVGMRLFIELELIDYFLVVE